jgi:hypothetical protein
MLVLVRSRKDRIFQVSSGYSKLVQVISCLDMIAQVVTD